MKTADFESFKNVYFSLHENRFSCPDTSLLHISHQSCCNWSKNIGKSMFLAGSVPIFSLASIAIGPGKYFHILRIYNWFIHPQSIKFFQDLTLY